MKIILGTVNIPKTNNDIKEWLKTAYKYGYRVIDSALIYGGGENEKDLFQASKELEKEGIVFELQTKLWPTKYKEARKTFLEQLKLSGRDSMDYYMLHRPSDCFENDVNAWKALVELKNEGKIKSLGVSNFDKDQIQDLIELTGFKPEFNQIESSITNFREDRVWYCKKNNIDIQAWSIMGKDTAKLLGNSTVMHLANKWKCLPSNIIVSFNRAQGINPIITSLKPDRLLTNLNFIKLSNWDIELLKKENIFDNKYRESTPKQKIYSNRNNFKANKP